MEFSTINTRLAMPLSGHFRHANDNMSEPLYRFTDAEREFFSVMLEPYRLHGIVSEVKYHPLPTIETIEVVGPSGLLFELGKAPGDEGTTKFLIDLGPGRFADRWDFTSAVGVLRLHLGMNFPMPSCGNPPRKLNPDPS